MEGLHSQLISHSPEVWKVKDTAAADLVWSWEDLPALWFTDSVLVTSPGKHPESSLWPCEGSGPVPQNYVPMI